MPLVVWGLYCTWRCLPAPGASPLPRSTAWRAHLCPHPGTLAHTPHTHTHTPVEPKNVHEARKSNSLVRSKTSDVKCQHVGLEVPMTTVPWVGVGGELCGAQVGLLETLTPHPEPWLDSGCADICLQIHFHPGIKVNKYFFKVYHLFFLVCASVLYFFNLAFFKSFFWQVLTLDPSLPSALHIHDLV